MDRKTYDRMTNKELVGRKVRTLDDLGTRLVFIPAGTTLTITHKYNGFELEGQPCPTCKVQVRITRVRPVQVELLPREVP